MPAITSLGSSSGLPLEKLLQDLTELQKQKLIPLNNQKTTYNEQLTGYSVLRSALWKLENSAATLRQSSLFKATKVTSNNTVFNAAITGTASPGSWQVSVQNLANAHSLTTAPQTSSTGQLGDVTGGSRTLTITQPGLTPPSTQTQLTVTLLDNQTSLNAIRDAINSKFGPVNAAVIQDSGGQYLLTLTAKNTGTASAMTVNVSSEDPALQTILNNMTETVPAQNAAFTFNGTGMIGQSNTIEDIPPGVTLTLQSESPPGITEQLKIQSDTSTAAKALQDFVTAYNELQDTIAYLTRYQPGAIKNGELLGEGTVRNIQMRLRNLLTGEQSGIIKYLSNLGIGFDETGHLTVNYYKMGRALSEKPDDVISFLTGNNRTTGLATETHTFLFQAIGYSGNIKAVTDSIKLRIRNIDNQIARTTAMSAREMETLKTQFANLDRTVTDLNRTSDYLNQQFKIINGTRG